MVMISSTTLSLDTRRWSTVNHPKKKSASMKCKHLGSPRSKEFEMRKSAGKAMTSVLWDRKDVLLNVMEKGTTVNVASYCATLERLRVAIQWQRSGLLTTGVLLLHNNLCISAPNKWRDCNTTSAVQQRFKWKPLERPPHSQDLALGDYFFLQAVKD
jgi:hypothetical protein